jgi:malonyl-CoA O-methyltransferase
LTPDRPLDPRDAYDRVADNYPAEAHNPLMRLEERAVLELLPRVTGLRVLDVGCGTGRYLRRLREEAPEFLAGCDLSARMLAEARRLLAPAGPPPLARADVLCLPLPDARFDVVVAGLVLGHVEDLARATREVARVLVPGGVAVWSDVHPAGTLSGWVRELRDARGRRIVIRQHVHLLADHRAAGRASGLEVEDVREPVIDFDHPQRGWPAVLAVLARKRT